MSEKSVLLSMWNTEIFWHVAGKVEHLVKHGYIQIWAKTIQNSAEGQFKNRKDPIINKRI